MSAFDTFHAFTARATADPDVAGLLLKGSHAHDGMATPHSDHDVYVVLADDATGTGGLADLDGHRSAALDLVVTTVTGFRELARGFERYAVARSRVLLDRLDGEIAAIVAGAARLTPDEASRSAATWLDAYANSLYRSLKNARDGHALAARLDATDSVGHLLELLFALDRRPRPYNRYLAWELARHPLPGWPTTPLLDTLTTLTTTGDPAPQHHLFTQVEPAARTAGHGRVLDAWGEDLRLMRGAPGKAR